MEPPAVAIAASPWSDESEEVPPPPMCRPTAWSSSSTDGVAAGCTLVLGQPQGRPLLVLLVGSSGKGSSSVWGGERSLM